MVRSRRTWTRIAAWGGTLAASVAALLGLAWFLRSGDLDRNDKIASAAGILISLAGLVVAILQLLRQPPAAPVDEAARLDRAAETLAQAVRAQWQAEAGLRALRRPAPLRLTWASTSRPVAAPAETITGATLTGRVVRLRLHGHLGEVADKFLALPHRRLVVLGEPGAGKTVLAMLLTLELLARRQPGQPVPVLLGLSSWDPTTEHLHTWLARRLGEDYPALASPTHGPAAPQQLIRSGRVLPVLDGLDELPEPLRASAIGELDRARADRPLVVTCRSQEYQHAVAAGGGTLAAAAVVELEPVTAAEAIAFLRRAAAPTPERWDRVAAYLHADPDGALAAALSTPLMVALARTIYTSPGRDPSELVGLAQTDGQAAVERHLLDGFIPAAYTTPPPDPDAPAPRLYRPPSAELAHRWLTRLASYLHQRHTPDLAWWQLPRLLPQRARRFAVGLAVGLPSGLLVGLAVGLAVGPPSGLVAGFATGPPSGLLDWLAPGLPSGLLDWLAPGLASGFVLGIALGVALAAGPVAPTRVRIRIRRRLRVAEFRDGPTTFALKVALAIGVALGLTFGVVGWLSVVAADMLGNQTATPEGMILALLLAMNLAMLMVGLPAGLVFALGLTLMQWLRSPADDARAVTPWSVLRDDRTAAIVLGLVDGLVFGLMGGLGGKLKDALAYGLGFGLVGGLAAGLGLTAWGQLTIVRAWLAVSRKLPWRLMAFLHDAHHRGVLRQTGAVYQFRHARLQAHLADTSLVSHTDR
jgi:hypothetical protein